MSPKLTCTQSTTQMIFAFQTHEISHSEIILKWKYCMLCRMFFSSPLLCHRHLNLIHLNGLISDDALMAHAAQLCAYAGNLACVLDALYLFKCMCLFT